jgi:hypothetical protein
MRSARDVPAIIRRSAVVLIAPLLALLALAAWAVASPVGSSPDDDFHLSSIWCGWGERPGLCEAGPKADERVVPKAIIADEGGGLATCYVHRPDLSGSCQGADFATWPETKATDRGNFADHLYPPVYYAAMATLVGHDVDVSVIAMRLVNSAIAVGMITAVWWLLPRSRRNTLVISVIATSVPLGLFLYSSINPSAWALVSAATLWVSLLGYYETEGRRRIGLAVTATIATVLGAGARADSALFAVMSIVIVVFMAFRRERGFLLRSILPAVLVVVAVLLYRTGAQSSAASTGISGSTVTSLGEARGLFVLNLPDIPSLWAGVFGTWGLGWIDPPLPPVVWFGALGVAIVAFVAGLGSVSPRKLIAVGLVVLAAWAYPMALLIQSSTSVGSYFQPRYVLPLLIIALGLATLRARRDLPSPNRWQLALGIAALATAAGAALHITMRRYLTGLDVHSLDLDAGREWWWPAMPPPLLVWAVGTVAFTALLVVLARPAWERAGQASGPVGITEANAGTTSR